MCIVLIMLILIIPRYFYMFVISYFLLYFCTVHVTTAHLVAGNCTELRC
jgi:hypothetical protein